MKPVPEKRRRLLAAVKAATLIRFFHPGDGAAETDWDAWIADRIGGEDADDIDLLAYLRHLFADVAPAVRFGDAARNPPKIDRACLVWRQNGYVEAGGRGNGPYRRERVQVEPAEAHAGRLHYHTRIAGLRVSIPLVAPIGDQGRTEPPSRAYRADASDSTTSDRGAPARVFADASVRLAVVAKIWGVLKCFYPYQADVTVDWDKLLDDFFAICELAEPSAIFPVLRRGLAKLDDNHISLIGEKNFVPSFCVPIGFNAVEGRIVVTYLARDVAGLAPGDELVAIDGRSIGDILRERRPYALRCPRLADDEIAMGQLIRRRRDEPATLSMRGADGSVRDLGLPCSEECGSIYWATRKAFYGSRTSLVRKVGRGVALVDLALARVENVDKCLECVLGACGIILDLRSYPVDPGGWRKLLESLIGTPVTSLPLYFHEFSDPAWQHRQKRMFVQTIHPRAPAIRLNTVALAGRYTVSQGEQALGFVRDAGFPIVGETTYGANGDINRITFGGGPEAEGGFAVTFTGMEVRQTDGTRFIGVGLRPDHEVPRTIAGIRGHVDEQLAYALALLEGGGGPASIITEGVDSGSHSRK